MIEAGTAPAPVRIVPAMVERPDRPLGAVQFLKTATSNTLGICDTQMFEELIVQRRYGPFHIAFVSDPAGVKRILVDAVDTYPRLSTIRRLYQAEIGTGTLASEGETWERHRRVATAVIDHRSFAPSLPTLNEQAESDAETWRHSLGAEPFDIGAKVAALYVGLLNQELTGGDPQGLPILHWLKKVPRKPKFFDVLPLPAPLRSLVSSGRQSGDRRRLSESLRQMIARRLEPEYAGGKDMLWRIAHTADRKTGLTLPLAEMRDEAASIAAAGDAAIRALTWFWYLLALRPDVEARVHAEVDALLGDGRMTTGHLTQAPYLRRVLDEVMRLYPPIPVVVRQASRTDEVCGVRIARGTYVFVMPWVIHRHRRLWDDPDSFDPDRFLPEPVQARPRLAYLPFSTGPRVCSGASYALAQITIILLALTRRYRFQLLPNRPVQPFGGISLQPRGGLWMTLKDRRPNIATPPP